MLSPKMKTLGIDLRCLPSDGSAGGGVAHAARAIADAIHHASPERVVCYVPSGAFLTEKVAAELRPYTDVLRNASSYQVAWLEDVSRRSLKRGLEILPCDLLFVPSGAVSPGLPVPAVPWVHDCDIFDHPEWFPQPWLKRQMTTRLFLRGIRRAPHVFAVSEYTKRAIERLVPTAIGKITVTGEGGDGMLMGPMKDHSHASGVRLPEAKHQAMASLKTRDITRQFVLVLGTVEPRKNIPLICRIWPEVVKVIPDARLIIAGQDGWKTGEIYRAMHGIPSIIRRQDVDDEERRRLILDAELILVPSFSEGFGLVALESIQAGTPVLTSNRGALPEVVGSGPWLLDPTDDHAWRDTIIHVLSDDAFRQDIIVRQSVRRELFSWENTAGVILGQLNR